MKKVTVNLALFSSSIAIALGMVEIGLRLFCPQSLGLWYKTRDGLTILRPNHTGLARGIETVQVYQTNAFGMRDREHQIEKQEGVFRILILGDSFMEALQVDFVHALPKKLEDVLNEGSERVVEVINAAVSGWGTDDQLTYLLRYGRHLKPDLILVSLTLHNDIYDNLDEEFHHFVGNKLLVKPREVIPYFVYKFWQLKAFLGAHLHCYQLLRQGWHAKAMAQDGRQLNSHVADLVRKKPSTQLKKGWEMTYVLLKQIQDTGRQSGAELVIVLMPLSIQLDEEKLIQFIRAHRLSEIDFDLYQPQQMVKNFTEAQGIETIDLLPPFRSWEKETGKPVFLKYDGHLTKTGHEVATRVIGLALIEKGFLKEKQKVRSTYKE